MFATCVHPLLPIVIAGSVVAAFGCGADHPMGDAPIGPPMHQALTARAVLPPCTEAVTAAFTRSSLWPFDRRQPPDLLTPTARDALIVAVRAGVEGRYGMALIAADAADYTLCAAGDVRLLEPQHADGPVLAWRTDAAIDVILEVPHPIHEPDTLTRGRAAFARREVSALLVAGSHRCASPRPSQCDGRTGVCGGGLFRVSDPAHTADSAFHEVHEVLVTRRPETLVISLHNMRGAGVSLSDGTRGPVSADSPVALAARSIARDLPQYTITTCNPGAGVPVEERLCGTTNVQGRHLNGSDDPCDEPVRRGSGRFLHLEWNTDMPLDDADALLDLMLDLPAPGSPAGPAPALGRL